MTQKRDFETYQNLSGLNLATTFTAFFRVNVKRVSGVKSGNRLYPSLECGFAKYPLVEVKSCTEVQYTFCKLSYNRPLYPSLFLESIKGSCGKRTTRNSSRVICYLGLFWPGYSQTETIFLPS